MQFFCLQQFTIYYSQQSRLESFLKPDKVDYTISYALRCDTKFNFLLSNRICSKGKSAAYLGKYFEHGRMATESLAQSSEGICKRP